jgi:hypothetical protein
MSPIGGGFPSIRGGGQLMQLDLQLIEIYRVGNELGGAEFAAVMAALVVAIAGQQ